MSADKDTTHFGFAEVPVTEKARRVRGVFDSVASRYDLMNDLMSLGIHRLWKRFTVEKACLRPGMQVLDLAGGTGDLAALMAPRVAPDGRVVLSDINEAMLRRGRERLMDRGIAGEAVEYCLADAEKLPLDDGRFDVVTIAFGLRNVTRKEAALAAQRHPQGSRAGRDVPRPPSRRPAADPRILAAGGPAGARL